MQGSEQRGGWEVTDGPRSVMKQQRETEAAAHDALIMLCG